MEFLDAYDENETYLGEFSREEVHERGLWHNTIHCWLYDKDGNIFFQVRSDANKLYTTSSGHVHAGETIKEAFGREVKEEIGIEVDYNKAELLDIVTWKMDKEKNGKVIKDRAFANVYLLCIDENDYIFNFTDGEVIGIVKTNAHDTLKLFNNEVLEINGVCIDNSNNKINRLITNDDFVLMNGETLLGKYGNILEAVKRK